VPGWESTPTHAGAPPRDEQLLRALRARVFMRSALSRRARKNATVCKALCCPMIFMCRFPSTVVKRLAQYRLLLKECGFDSQSDGSEHSLTATRPLAEEEGTNRGKSFSFLSFLLHFRTMATYCPSLSLDHG
jgi:hypothetical protein